MKRLNVEWIPSPIVAVTLTVVPPITACSKELSDSQTLQRGHAEKSALTKVIVLAREQGRIRTVTNSTVNRSFAPH